MPNTLPNSHTSDVWLLYDQGKIGSKHQCVGLAESLGLKAQVKEVKMPSWHALPFMGWFEKVFNIKEDLEPYGLGKPWPQVVLASGRKAVSVAARLRRLSGGKTRAIILQKPYQSFHDFDGVICPRHDLCSAYPHVIETLGSLHHITLEKLAEAGRGWDHRPGVLVLIGAPSQDHEASMMAWLQRWIDHAESQGETVYIVTSRRTPSHTIQKMKKNLQGPVAVWDPSSLQPNPYLAALANAQRIVVTGDSVNMLTESCFTARPVYIWRLGMYRSKFRAFHESLIQGGHARWALPVLETFQANPLREIERLKDLLMRLIQGARP